MLSFYYWNIIFIECLSEDYMLQDLTPCYYKKNKDLTLLIWSAVCFVNKPDWLQQTL